MSPARPRPRVELTEAAERILARRYPGQVPAVVIERALRRLAALDARRARTEARR